MKYLLTLLFLLPTLILAQTSPPGRDNTLRGQIARDLYNPNGDNLITKADSALNGQNGATLPVSVLKYGAVADADTNAMGLCVSGTDNTASFQAAITTNQGTKKPVLSVPAGLWRVNGELVATKPLAIILEPGAIVFFPNSTPAKYLLTSYSSLHLLGGGTLVGNWNRSANNTTNVASGRITEQKLVRIEPPTSSTAPVSDVVIENITFRYAGDYATHVAHDNQPINKIRLTLANCRFYQNYNAFLIRNFGSAPLENLKIENNTIDGTACPGGDPRLAGSHYHDGGNAMTFWGVYKNATVNKMTILNSGRMGLEVYVVAAPFSDNIKITNSKIYPCYNFALSLAANNVTISDNYIGEKWGEGNELFGNNYVIERNTFDGASVNSGPTPYPNGAGGNGVRIVANTFLDNDQQRYNITLSNATNFVIENNTIINKYARSSSMTGFGPARAAIDIVNSVGGTISNNKVVSSGGYNYPVLRIFSSAYVNTAGINTFSFVGIAPNQINRIYDISGLYQCDISGIQTNSTTSFYPSDNLSFGQHQVNAPLYKLTKSASGALTKTACTNTSVDNAPPATPATGSLYVVSDSPTGTWAGHPRSFAAWNGSAWSYTPITDAALNYTDSVTHYMYRYVNVPIRTNENWLLFDAYVMSNVRFQGNNFDAGGKITRFDIGISPFNFSNASLFRTVFAQNQTALSISTTIGDFQSTTTSPETTLAALKAKDDALGTMSTQNVDAVAITGGTIGVGTLTVTGVARVKGGLNVFSDTGYGELNLGDGRITKQSGQGFVFNSSGSFSGDGTFSGNISGQAANFSGAGSFGGNLVVGNTSSATRVQWVNPSGKSWQLYTPNNATPNLIIGQAGIADYNYFEYGTGRLIMGSDLLVKGQHLNGFTTPQSLTADGTATQFTVTHGLNYVPTVTNITPLTANAVGGYVDVSQTTSSVYVIKFATAPTAGTLKFSNDIH